MIAPFALAEVLAEIARELHLDELYAERAAETAGLDALASKIADTRTAVADLRDALADDAEVIETIRAGLRSIRSALVAMQTAPAFEPERRSRPGAGRRRHP